MQGSEDGMIIPCTASAYSFFPDFGLCSVCSECVYWKTLLRFPCLVSVKAISEKIPVEET